MIIFGNQSPATIRRQIENVGARWYIFRAFIAAFVVSAIAFLLFMLVQNPSLGFLDDVTIAAVLGAGAAACSGLAALWNVMRFGSKKPRKAA